MVPYEQLKTLVGGTSPADVGIFGTCSRLIQRPACAVLCILGGLIERPQMAEIAVYLNFMDVRFEHTAVC